VAWHSRAVAVGRHERFEELRPRLVALFGEGEALTSVFAVLTLMEMAWHDCYGEVTPPASVMDDVLRCSPGTLAGLVHAAQLAVIDRRDLRLQADQIGD
jgi:hypothetical protein